MSYGENPPTDDDNPEWSAADFDRARPASELPADVLASFPATAEALRGSETVTVSIALSADVVRFFRDRSSDWQSEINDVLKKAIAR